MFEIHTHTNPYLTYVIGAAATGSRLCIVPERGGVVTQWAVGDRELLYLDHPRFADPQLSVRGGIPVLFPICGNLPQDTYQFAGQSYQLSQHGFARSMPWTVVAQEAIADRGSLTVALTSTAATRAVYPWEFRLELTYSLLATELQIHQRVTNLSADLAMPFAIGYHPYFQVADKTSLQFHIPADRAYSKSGVAEPFNGSFDWSQGEIDLSFHPLDRSATQVADPHSTLTLSWDYPDGHLVFWTLPGQDFYCLEPWSAGRNAMNTGVGMVQLPSGQTWSSSILLSYH
jgi:galactose mutarotase-like enzyme